MGPPTQERPSTGAASHGPPPIQSLRPFVTAPLRLFLASAVSAARRGDCPRDSSGPSALCLLKLLWLLQALCLPMCTGTSLSVSWGKSVLDPRWSCVESDEEMPEDCHPDSLEPSRVYTAWFSLVLCHS